MKKIVWAVLVFSVSFFACSDNKSGSKEEQEEKTTQAVKNISRRDRSINTSNSYSDLFFDSTRVEKFIKEKKIIDSIHSRLSACLIASHLF